MHSTNNYVVHCFNNIGQDYKQFISTSRNAKKHLTQERTKNVCCSMVEIRRFNGSILSTVEIDENNNIYYL